MKLEKTVTEEIVERIRAQKKFSKGAPVVGSELGGYRVTECITLDTKYMVMLEPLKGVN